MEQEQEQTNHELQRWRALIHQYRERDVLAANQEIFQFVKGLQVRHPDYSQYQLYHILIGSTLEGDKFDFAGEDSIAKFIEEHAVSRGD